MNNNRQKIILFPISIEELETLMRECIKSEFHKIIPPPTEKDEDVVITRKEVAKLLGISTATVSKFCKIGALVSYRIGNQLKFKKAEVLKALKEIKTIKYSRQQW